MPLDSNYCYLFISSIYLNSSTESKFTTVLETSIEISDDEIENDCRQRESHNEAC